MAPRWKDRGSGFGARETNGLGGVNTQVDAGVRVDMVKAGSRRDEASTPAESAPPQVVVRDGPASSPVSQRVDFGAHLEGNYQRLVAQVYAITLDPGEAHDAVQDAYSRAWRRWPEIVASTDPTAWVRRVAVRTTQRSWRRVFGRLGLTRPRPVGDADPRTSAMLAALGRLPVAERRAVVLHHMVGMSHAEIAALEQTGDGTVRDRLDRAHVVVFERMADELPSVLGLAPQPYEPDLDMFDDRYADERPR